MRKTAFAMLLFAAPLAAQVPQGWYVFGTFGGSPALQKGLFLAHPRNPGQPTEITGLQGDLVVTGAASVLYRQSDGAILCGERSPQNTASVDLHVIHLQGTSVVRDASFSVGTGGPCCGEIPQMGLLPDGRVVVAATDLSAGPLKQYLTTSYGWQGVGIVDTTSGLITVVPITNGASIVDVFNGLAVSPDYQHVYLGTYVSATRGDIWRVPLPAGGTATLVASVPAGLSNMTFDDNGDLWVTTLDTMQGLFRVNVSTGAVTKVSQTNGALNAIAYESTTGNLAVVSATAGNPNRSIFWMEPNGADHLLSQPGLATPAGIAVHPNPAAFGAGSGAGTYQWVLSPNPGGLPELGNAKFSLTVATTGPAPQLSMWMLATGRLAQAWSVLGVDVWVDPSQLVLVMGVGGAAVHTLPLAIPNDASLTGLSLFVQSMHQQSSGVYATSPGVQFTVL